MSTGTYTASAKQAGCSTASATQQNHYFSTVTRAGGVGQPNLNMQIPALSNSTDNGAAMIDINSVEAQ